MLLQENSTPKLKLQR